MKHTTITCDICGREIIFENGRIDIIDKIQDGYFSYTRRFDDVCHECIEKIYKIIQNMISDEEKKTL